MTVRSKRIAAVAAVLLSLSGTALAHTGHGDTSGFAHGFSHPLGGIDHMLAMMGVGLYAALLGGRPLWLVPATFVGVMGLGGVVGAAGYALPYVEIAIALSVIVLGSAVALRLSLPTLGAMALVGLFAIFHGYAHGTEMPPDASGYAYAAGFLLVTALLHLAGIAVGMLAASLADRGGWRAVQAAGGAMTVAGMFLLCVWFDML
jgi:urease accessory protein